MTGGLSIRSTRKSPKSSESGWKSANWTRSDRRSGGEMPMANDPRKTRRRHVREKSVIDHLARKLFEPRPETDGENGMAAPGPVTDTGLSVEEQVRKEWDPGKGGLPIF